jgi:hypothetical protein
VWLVLENGRVTGEEHLLTDRGGCCATCDRDPTALYLVTDGRCRGALEARTAQLITRERLAGRSERNGLAQGAAPARFRKSAATSGFPFPS